MPLSPAFARVDGKRYDYKRYLVEILECQTCGAMFNTHIPSGVGWCGTPTEDTELCAGCAEICKQLNMDDVGHAC